jgi:hypothetical protein
MARRLPRSFGIRYAPLLVALVAVLVLIGLRTDDDLGVDIPERTDSAAALPTSTTEADEPEGTLPTTTTNPVLDDPADVPE